MRASTTVTAGQSNLQLVLATLGPAPNFWAWAMLPLLSVLTMVPVLFLGFVGQYTYATILIGGFFLGVSGTTCAIGVPCVNARWDQLVPHRRRRRRAGHAAPPAGPV